MKLITVDEIMALKPCKSYSREVVKSLWRGCDGLTLHNILDLNILAFDRVWAVTAFLPARTQRLFAADCAASCRNYLPEHDHERFDQGLQMIRDYANGLINDSQLEDVRAQARDSRDTSLDALITWTWDTLSDALGSLAWKSAWIVARDTSWGSPGLGAWEDRLKLLEKYIDEFEAQRK